ncbi:MAG TPA: c-type cytochrome [Oceanipulchritudo sp.]|nr:c-type cytochrome [Oceanipulchritudo sp.]
MKALLMTPLLLAVAATSGQAQESLAEAEAIWNNQCAKCHGKDGKGQTKMGLRINAANLADPAVQEKISDERILEVMMNGAKDEKGKVVMLPAKNVTDDQLQQLVEYVRSFAK